MRVLLGYDDLRMAALLKRGLGEEGCAVDVVFTGPAILWHATKFPYDAIVVDALSPEVDGIEACRQLRSTQCWVPILILTDRAASGQVNGLEAGADACLTKPFSVAEFTAQLTAMIRGTSAPPPNELWVGELRMDPATRRAWRGRVELQLTTKEFALLRLFVTHAGTVLTRRQILEHIWDLSRERSPNLVDQYVLYLRRKIDRPFGLQQLETVRGAGFRLREHPVKIRRTRS